MALLLGMMQDIPLAFASPLPRLLPWANISSCFLTHLRCDLLGISLWLTSSPPFSLLPLNIHMPLEDWKCHKRGDIFSILFHCIFHILSPVGIFTFPLLQLNLSVCVLACLTLASSGKGTIWELMGHLHLPAVTVLVILMGLTTPSNSRYLPMTQAVQSAYCILPDMVIGSPVGYD